MGSINILLLQGNIQDHKLVSQCLKGLEKIVHMEDQEKVVPDQEKEAQAYPTIKERYPKLNQMKDLKKSLGIHIKELGWCCRPNHKIKIQSYNTKITRYNSKFII